MSLDDIHGPLLLATLQGLIKDVYPGPALKRDLVHTCGGGTSHL